MEIRCPHCRTLYRLDPATFPRRRLRLRCAACGRAFTVAEPDDDDAGAAWALRLARTLVQDLVRRVGSMPAAGAQVPEFAAALARRRRAYEQRVGSEDRLGAVFDAVVAEVMAAARDDERV